MPLAAGFRPSGTGTAPRRQFVQHQAANRRAQALQKTGPTTQCHGNDIRMNEMYKELTLDCNAYWASRYASDASPYEWYRSYETLAPVLATHILKADRILHVGVGTSTLQEGMAEDGFNRIVNVDFSEECIDACRARWLRHRLSATVEMAFSVHDVRDLRSAFNEDTFDVVLDKGTLDALICADDDTGCADTAMRQLRRVLRPGGRYIWCTTGVPAERVRYLRCLEPEGLFVYSYDADGKCLGSQSHIENIRAMKGGPGVHFVYVIKLPNAA